MVNGCIVTIEGLPIYGTYSTIVREPSEMIMAIPAERRMSLGVLEGWYSFIPSKWALDWKCVVIGVHHSLGAGAEYWYRWVLDGIDTGHHRRKAEKDEEYVHHILVTKRTNIIFEAGRVVNGAELPPEAVSYTHLTLPTTPYV